MAFRTAAASTSFAQLQRSHPSGVEEGTYDDVVDSCAADHHVGDELGRDRGARLVLLVLTGVREVGAASREEDGQQTVEGFVSGWGSTAGAEFRMWVGCEGVDLHDGGDAPRAGDPESVGHNAQPAKREEQTVRMSCGCLGGEVGWCLLHESSVGSSLLGRGGRDDVHISLTHTLVERNPVNRQTKVS